MKIAFLAATEFLTGVDDPAGVLNEMAEHEAAKFGRTDEPLTITVDPLPPKFTGRDPELSVVSVRWRKVVREVITNGNGDVMYDGPPRSVKRVEDDGSVTTWRLS